MPLFYNLASPEISPMKYSRLADSDLNISEIALGTMTFGQQNSVADAMLQLDYAAGKGVNFFDVAEMYPVPGKAETQGLSEEYLGKWLQTQHREQYIIATKIAGPSRGFNWIRNGPESIDRSNVLSAVESSLRRLKTDYIDLYQIHWPARNVPMFGNNYYNPNNEYSATPIEEQLTVLTELVKGGLIRQIGVSNETPWGVAEFLKVSERLGLKRIVSIQNPYNLINRTFEIGLHEMCSREKVNLLAYSPLAFGLLTGKYINNSPVNGRLSLYPAFGQRYQKLNVAPAVAAYVQLAEQFCLSPTQMAIAFVRSRPFVSSTIIGATTMDQLKQNLNLITLDEEQLKLIENIHLQYTNPAP